MIKKYYDKVITILASASIFFSSVSLVDVLNNYVNEAVLFRLATNGLILASAIIVLYHAIKKQLNAKKMLVPVGLYFSSLAASYAFTTTANTINYFNNYSNTLWIALAVANIVVYALALRDEKYMLPAITLLSIVGITGLLSLLAGLRSGVVNLTMVFTFIYCLYLEKERMIENEEE